MCFGLSHYNSKVEKKERTTAELLEVIEWLTGFNEAKTQELIEDKLSLKLPKVA
ncbi:MAG: DUF2200 family protein [Gelidibacter sp.]